MLVSNQYKNNTLTFKAKDKPNYEYKGIAYGDIGMEHLSPSELFDVYKQGIRYFNYDIHKNDDENLDTLNQYSDEYSKHPTMHNKQKLLDHEKNMIYEELEHPELSFARNYYKLSKIFENNNFEVPNNIDEQITLFNILSLKSLEGCFDIGFPTEYSDEKMEVLKNVFKNADEKTEIGLLTRKYTAQIMAILLIAGKKTNAEKEAVKNFLKANTSCDDIINLIYTKKDCLEDISELKRDIEQPTKFKEVLLCSNQENQESITNLIENVLTEDNSSKEIKQLAIWGAGKYRSDKNFEIIKNIALNTNEEDITTREFAINSTALYLREKPEEVVEIMDKISHDETIFAPLGQILKDKTTGNYHNQKEREFNYLSLPAKTRAEIYDFTSKKLNPDNDINAQRKNSLFGDLGYFAHFITKKKDDIAHTYITKDTYTSIHPEFSGSRKFNNRGDLANGTFYDSIIGINNPSTIMVQEELLKANGFNSVTGHEFAHQLNYFFDEKDNEKLEKLFQNSKKEHRFIRSYAETCKEEYFAVGMESYIKPYVSHKNLLMPEHRTSRYNLMEKDPELYNFIEEVLQKY